MLATCPNCLTQIVQKEMTSEVKCPDCATVFAAFLKVNFEETPEEAPEPSVPPPAETTGEHSSPGSVPSFDPPSFDAPPPEIPTFDPPAFEVAPSFEAPAFEAPAPEPAPALMDFGNPTGMIDIGPGPKSMSEPAEKGEFAESKTAFADIREFGETLQEKPKPAKAPPRSPAPGPNEAQPVPSPVLKTSGGGAWLMTSGDALQNHTIVEYLSPVSVLSELVPGDNPMAPAFAALRAQSAKLGGNGVVAMRWSLSGDASKVLVSGTAVKCAKS